MPTPTTATRTYRHKYPWRLEETITIASFLIFPTIIGAQPLYQGTLNPMLGAWWALMTLIAAWLTCLGSARKRRSELTATLTGTVLTINPTRDGKYGGSGDLALMTAMKVIDRDRHDPTIVFSTRPDHDGRVRHLPIQRRLALTMAAELLPHAHRCRKTETSIPFYEEIRDAATQ